MRIIIDCSNAFVQSSFFNRKEIFYFFDVFDLESKRKGFTNPARLLDSGGAASMSPVLLGSALW